MKIGYLGPVGTYSYEAACLYAESLDGKFDCVALPNFLAIIDGVEKKTIDRGIIPVENSTHGAVATAMDTLLHVRKSKVCGEITLKIEHCLLGRAKKMEEIRCVYSHEQALEQCSQFFYKTNPHMEIIYCASTSQACALALKNGSAYGAVASKSAAQRYNLTVLAQKIQDNPFNQTRFLIIGDASPGITGFDKTSIILAFSDDRPGSLYGVLRSFASRGINLTRIESRPAKHNVGQYIFYIDFQGHQHEAKGHDVLNELETQVSCLKVLGSYPMDNWQKQKTGSANDRLEKSSF